MSESNTAADISDAEKEAALSHNGSDPDVFDMCQFTDCWDMYKGNIMPLSQGRQLRDTLKMLSTLKLPAEEREQHVLQRRAEYEAQIMLYEGDDPLDPWYNYVLWCEQVYPSNSIKSQLMPLLEKVTSKFLLYGEKYLNDKRYINIWAKLVNHTESSEDKFQLFECMFAHGVSQRVSHMYVQWAEQLERVGDVDKAGHVYTSGVNNRAQPYDYLLDKYKKFKERCVVSELCDAAVTVRDEGEGGEEEHRRALTTFHPVQGADGSGGRLGTDRVLPQLTVQQGGGLDSKSQPTRQQQQQPRPTRVYKDPDHLPTDSLPQPVRGPAKPLVSKKQAQKENLPQTAGRNGKTTGGGSVCSYGTESSRLLRVPIFEDSEEGDCDDIEVVDDAREGDVSSSPHSNNATPSLHITDDDHSEAAVMSCPCCAPSDDSDSDDAAAGPDSDAWHHEPAEQPSPAQGGVITLDKVLLRRDAGSVGVTPTPRQQQRHTNVTPRHINLDIPPTDAIIKRYLHATATARHTSGGGKIEVCVNPNISADAHADEDQLSIKQMRSLLYNCCPETGGELYYKTMNKLNQRANLYISKLSSSTAPAAVKASGQQVAASKHSKVAAIQRTAAVPSAATTGERARGCGAKTTKSSATTTTNTKTTSLQHESTSRPSTRTGGVFIYEDQDTSD